MVRTASVHHGSLLAVLGSTQPVTAPKSTCIAMCARSASEVFTAQQVNDNPTTICMSLDRAALQHYRERQYPERAGAHKHQRVFKFCVEDQRASVEGGGAG